MKKDWIGTYFKAVNFKYAWQMREVWYYYLYSLPHLSVIHQHVLMPNFECEMY